MQGASLDARDGYNPSSTLIDVKPRRRRHAGVGDAPALATLWFGGNAAVIDMTGNEKLNHQGKGCANCCAGFWRRQPQTAITRMGGWAVYARIS